MIEKFCRGWWCLLLVAFGCGVYPRAAQLRWSDYGCPSVDGAIQRVVEARRDRPRLHVPIGSDRCATLLALGLPIERRFVRNDNNVRDPALEAWRYGRGLTVVFSRGRVVGIVERPDRSPTVARNYKR